MVAECGATAGWAGFNVTLAAGMLREAAAMTTQISGEVIPSDKPGSVAMATRQPVGVVLGIAPWSAPVILGVRAIAAPLACGNPVVLKASEICPGIHRLIGEVLDEAGLGKGVVNVATNAPADAPMVVEALIAHPAVRRVNFTGSTRVGRIIAEIAARHLKRALLELGGKAPLVMLDDADLDEAVKAAAFGSFMNQSQIGMSTERIMVDERVADAFVEKFAAKAASLPVGDPRTGNVVLGSLVGAEAVERVKGLIKDAVSLGAVIATGGESDGTVMKATVIDRVTSDMKIYAEESFRPDGRGRARRRCGRGDPGGERHRIRARRSHLQPRRRQGDQPRRRIESGICHINGPTVHAEAQMPSGGTKASGYGRFGGKAAIDEFTELRWITIQTTPRRYPF